MVTVFKSYQEMSDALEGKEPTTAQGLQKTYTTAGGANAGIEKPQTSEGTTQAAQTTNAFQTPEVKQPTQQAYTPKSYATGEVPQIAAAAESYQAPQASSFVTKLFEPIAKQVEAGKQQLGAAAQTFTQAAGPMRTYESAGAESALRGLVQSPYETQEARQAGVQKAKGYTQATYGGPTGLDTEAQQNLATLTGGLQAQSPYLTRAPGITELLKGYQAGMTPGQRTFEAQHLMQTPEFLPAAAQYQNLIGQFGQNVTTAQQEAQDIAKQRAAAEADIAAKSQQFLGGMQTGISTDIQKATDTANAQAAAAQQQWDKFQQAGDLGELETLEGMLTPQARDEQQRRTELTNSIIQDAKYGEIADIPPMTENMGKGTEYKFDPDWWALHSDEHSSAEWATIKKLAHARQKELDKVEGTIQTPDSVSSLNTEARKLSQEAPKAWQDVMDKYADIKDVPLLSMRSSRKGKEMYDQPAGMSRATYEQAAARQRELEAAGFSPGTQTSQEGKYGTVAPMYFSQGQEPWAPKDIRPYAQFVPAASPTRENMSTEDQKQHFNMITDILDKADKLVESDPYTAARMLVETDRYIKDEDMALGEIKDKHTTNQQAWAQQLKKIKRAHKKSHSGISGFLNKTGLGWVIPVLAGMVTFGAAAPAIGALGGGLLGAQAGMGTAGVMQAATGL